ncbi:YybH family protein [Niabella aurantiaca]|uniref:YybH family protein n=1 Tax=Niabella aurantiaca TaxID=379900 RepID=UPI000380FF23|nr:DUF4440 domain-containing protein [Niabella aurantiaca]
MKRTVPFLAVFILLMSCNQPQPIDTKAEGEKLMQVSRDWSKTVAGNDIEKIMSYWADDAEFFDNHEGKRLKGKAEIRKMVEESLKIPGFKISWEPESVSVSASGDMGYLVERNEISIPDSAGNPMIMRGTVVTIWKKDAAGNWKNVLEAGMDDAKQ